MAELYTEDKFWSAVKRKDVSEVLEIMFTQGHCTQAAAAAKDTTRLTDAAITRMRDALAKDMSGEDDELPPIDDELVDEAIEDGCDPITDVEDEANEVDATYKEIEKAISKGKGKKALKLIKQAKADGHKGSVLDGLKKQAKGL